MCTTLHTMLILLLPLIRCTFTLSLPSTLPPTSSTDFERVYHVLSVVALVPSPEYSEGSLVDIADSQKNPPQDKRSFFGRLSRTKSPKTSEPVQSPPAESSAANRDMPPLPPNFSPSLTSLRRQVKVVSPLGPKDTTAGIEHYDTEKLVPDLGIFRYMALTGYVSSRCTFLTCYNAFS